MLTRDHPVLPLDEPSATGGQPHSSLARSLMRLGAIAAAVLSILTALWLALLVLAPVPPPGSTAEQTVSFIGRHDGGRA